MGSSSSKQPTVKPTSTTPSAPTTVHTTIHTAAPDVEAPEIKCWIGNQEIMYMSLAFISGVLLTVLVFAIIYLCRKSYKKSHQNLQEEVSFQAAPEEYARSTQPQSEVAYSTLVFQRSRTPLAV